MLKNIIKSVFTLDGGPTRVVRIEANAHKVHLDGYDFLPYLTGKEQSGPRKSVISTSSA